jgi:long-chain fatty acid transport protein
LRNENVRSKQRNTKTVTHEDQKVMKKNICTGAAYTLIAVLTTVALPRPARGAGFLIYDMSAEAMGKASAVAASTREPAAIWFNPAAISFMPGYQFSAGGVAIVATNEFEPKGGGESVNADTGTFFLPTVYGTFQILDWLHAGIGVMTPFGLGISWPNDWQGREHCINASIETVTINPTLSFKVWKNVSIGVGFDLVYGAVDMKNGLPDPIGGSVRIGGTTFGYGANAGVTWRILPNLLHAAVAYRSRVKLSFDGKADFEPEAEEFAPTLVDQGGKSEITLPDIITIGFMYKPLKSLELTLDTNVVMWSTYDELKLDFEQESTPDETLERNFRDSVTVRLGVDYTLPVNPRMGRFQVRGGLIFDQNPSPKDTLAPSLPDANRIDVGAGFGYTYKWFTADIGYLLVYFLPSKSTTGEEGPEGTYKSVAHLMGLTLTARFGTTKSAPKQKDVPPPTRIQTETMAPSAEDTESQPPPAAAPPDGATPRPSTTPEDDAPRPATTPEGGAPRPATTPEGGAPRPATTPEGGAPRPARPAGSTQMDDTASRPARPANTP